MANDNKIWELVYLQGLPQCVYICDRMGPRDIDRGMLTPRGVGVNGVLEQCMPITLLLPDW